MSDAGSVVRHLQAGTMKVEIYPTSAGSGRAAAEAAAKAIRDFGESQDTVGVIFATGASQFHTLEALVSLQDVPWGRIAGVHLDEYVGLPLQHPASFRRYLRERLTEKVPLQSFFEIDGEARDPESFCREYGKIVDRVDPQVCLLGIGENGHVAFNEPGIADFEDLQAVRVVTLDAQCREQQAAEGWFADPSEVPKQAITLTIPTVLRVPKLIVTVPGKRKSAIMRKTLFDAISTACPATILRTHPDVTVYLDEESARDLD